MSKLRKEGECSEKIIFLYNRLSLSLFRNKVALMFKLAEFHRCLKSQSGQTLNTNAPKMMTMVSSTHILMKYPRPLFGQLLQFFWRNRPTIHLVPNNSGNARKKTFLREVIPKGQLKSSWSWIMKLKRDLHVCFISCWKKSCFAENRFLEEKIETTKARESKRRHQQKKWINQWWYHDKPNI